MECTVGWGPLSRPFIRSGQWSQTTAGVLQPADRPSGTARAVRCLQTEELALFR